MNYKEQFPEAHAVEVKDRNVLIMRKLDSPMRRFDGKMARWELEHRWLSADPDSAPDAVHCVQGNDFTYWQEKEWDKNKPLLEQFMMIG